MPLTTRPDVSAVEQTRYECVSAQKRWEPLPPIVFTVEGGKEGIDLVNAMKMDYSYFDDRDKPMFSGGAISLRMEVRPSSYIGSRPNSVPPFD
jgi:hypothetical protein